MQKGHPPRLRVPPREDQHGAPLLFGGSGAHGSHGWQEMRDRENEK